MTESQSSAQPPFERLQALLLLLPAAAFLWPSVQGVPTADSAAAGLIAIAALPAAALQLLRGTSARPVALYALFAVWLVAAYGRRSATDTFGADRALVTLASAAVLVSAGATLGAAGRRVLLIGGSLLGLAFTASASFGPACTGLVGNTGDLSEVALAGGVLGIGLFLFGAGALRVLGLVAALGHALYAGLVPVHAGSVGWLAATIAAFACAPARPTSARLARLALLASLVAVLAAGARTLAADDSSEPGPANEAPSLVEDAELGGASFRLATWRALPALVEAHPLFGAGPGQFAAAFPPFRDPAELEASSRGRAEPTPQEVEHAHNDWLQGFAELGLIGGGTWFLFLVLVLARALRALREEEPERAALGLAAIALLANAALNSNLLGGVAAPALAWPLFGALLAPQRMSSGTLARRLPLLLVLLLALQGRTAWSLFAHGNALHALADSVVVDSDGMERSDPRRVEQVLRRALAARPDSPVALEKRNQFLAATNAEYAQRLPVLQRWITHRPHQFAALLSLGSVQARAGNLASARDAYARAAALDPSHPALLQNRLALALDSRDVDGTRAALEAAMGAGHMDGDALRRRAARALLSGRIEVGQVLVDAWAPPSPEGPDAMTAVRYDAQDPNAAFAASKELRDLGREGLADGFLVAFNLAMSREHRASGLDSSAVRVARLALRLHHENEALSGDDGALLLELACALAAAERAGEAREALAGRTIPNADLRALDPADLTLLLASGVLEIVDGAATPVPPED